jgi:rRNA-processing protein FCF1
MNEKVIIDTNSLIDLFRYYEKIDNFKVILSLLKTDITSGKIIILDKVFGELSTYVGPDKSNIIKKLELTKTQCQKTEDLVPELMKKSKDWYIKSNE